MGGPAVGLIILLGLLAVASIPLGVLLLLLGLRGKRAGNAPTCARCNFDLQGIATGPGTKCPECGGLLDGKVATGRRARRTAMVLLGTAVLLVGLGTVIGMLASGGWTRLNPYKPAFILRTEMVLDGGLRDPAIRELNSRLAAGSLSQSTIANIVDKALALQADESRKWIPLLGDFVEGAHAKGKLPDAQWRAYILTAIKPRLDVTTRIAQGEDVASDLKIGPGRVSQAFQMQVISKIDDVTIDGKPASLGQTGLSTITSALTSSGSAWQSRKINAREIPAGNHELVARVTASLVDDPAMASTQTLKFAIRVLPVGEPAHKLISDPALRSQVAQAIAMDYLELTREEAGKASVNYSIRFTDLPVNAAFDLVLKHKSENAEAVEITVGSVNCRRTIDKGQMGHGGGGEITIPETVLRQISAAGTLEIELRPSLAVAKSQTNLYEIWGEPVTLRVTPTVRFPDTPSK